MHIVHTTSNQPLLFLTKKIRETGRAIFRADSDTVLKLPDNIVSISHVDEDGYIYFVTSCYGSFAKEVKNEFYAYLEFHEKGRDSNLRVGGKATLLHDNYDNIVFLYQPWINTTGSLVTVKLKIMKAEYTCGSKADSKGWKNKLKTIFNNWWLPENNSRYDFH